MFRMMKLRQNVKSKVLSFAVSLAVLALTIVGAFAVNFGHANAQISGGNITWGEFKEAVLAEYPLEMWPASGNSSFAYFENEFKSRIDNKNYFISLAWKTSDQGFLDEFSMCIIRTNSSGTFEWANDEVGLMDTLGGTRYISNGFVGFSCSKTTGIHTYSNYGSYSGSSFNRLVDFNNTVKWANTIAVRNQEGATCWFSQDVYSRANGSLISSKNLFDDPQSAYENLIIKTGDRYYFTITDQYIIRNAAAGDEGFLIEFEDSSYPGVYKQYYNNAIDFTYMSIYAYPNVTNISPNGILAWDITDIINYSTYDRLVYSNISGNHLTWFGDNIVTITRDNVPDPWSTYYDYLNDFLDALEVPSVPVPDQVPSYVSQQITTNYPGNVYVTTIGDISGFVQINEFPSIPFDLVLVIDAKAFDVLSVQLAGVLTMQENVFAQSFLPELLQQVDMICVMQHADFDYVVSDYANHPDNFLYFQPNQWQISGTPYAHGMWYIASVIDSNGAGDPNKKPCYSFVTERYLQKCNNWILSDGVDFLYKALNALNDNQTNFFSGALNAIGATVASIQLCNGKLSQLYDYFTMELNLADKFEQIIDKLDKIADNTSEQNHDFWFISLYNWIVQYAPSNSDFAQWVSDLTEFEQSLPDPEATPAATVIPFPTVTASAG